MTLNTQSLKSLDEVRVFLAGSSAVSFESPTGAGRYLWLTVALRQFHYGRLARADKGVLRAFLGKVTGYSGAQLCRLIAQWQKGRKIVDRRGPPAKPLAQRYTATDVVLLAKLDHLHGQLSGPATKKLAERAVNVFGDVAFKALACISVAHLYNLRASACYQRQQRRWWANTSATAASPATTHSASARSCATSPPHLNYHRPGLFPEFSVDEQGRYREQQGRMARRSASLRLISLLECASAWRSAGRSATLPSVPPQGEPACRSTP